MWLSFTNLDTGKEYYPIRLEAEESAASAPQLNKLDGVLYLTYITGGSEFHLMDISSFMTDLFVTGNARGGRGRFVCRSSQCRRV